MIIDATLMMRSAPRLYYYYFRLGDAAAPADAIRRLHISTMIAAAAITRMSVPASSTPAISRLTRHAIVRSAALMPQHFLCRLGRQPKPCQEPAESQPPN